jgi:drug/metabolite transporter (DMT)-like permease
MDSKLFIAIFSGLGGMLGWGFADFFAKKTIDKIGDIPTLFWSQLIGIFPLLILFLIKPSIPELNNYQWFYLILLGLCDGLIYVPVYKAFKKGKVSLLSPVFATFPLIVTLLSAFIFGETISLRRQILFLLIFSSVLLLEINPQEIQSIFSVRMKNVGRNVKGLPEIILAVFLYALWIIALDRLISNISWLPILLAVRILSAFSIFLYAIVSKTKILFFEKKLWINIFFIGLFDVAAFSFISYGLSKTSYVSIVIMLSGAFSLPVIILGRFLLNEKLSRLQIIASMTIILGIMLLSFI